jgi:hypothetical protein
VNPLLQLLASMREAVVARWLDRILEGYAADQVHFLRQEQDRFQNPVGHTLRENLPVLLEAVLLGRQTGASRSAMDAIVRLRAVQDFSPAQAVSFVPLLKDAVREELRNCRLIEPQERGHAELETRIDELARLAAELYARCRDQIRRIKADELRRRSFVMDRAGRADVRNSVSAGPEPDRDAASFPCGPGYATISSRRPSSPRKLSVQSDDIIKF